MFIIVTQKRYDGPENGFDSIRVFVSNSKMENLAENYRNWLYKWLDEEDDLDQRYVSFKVLNAFSGTTIDTASLQTSAGRAIGMREAERLQKEAQERFNSFAYNI